MLKAIQTSIKFAALALSLTAVTAMAQDPALLDHNHPTVPHAVPSPTPGQSFVEPQTPTQRHVPTWQPPHHPYHGPKLGITAVGTGHSVEVVGVSYGTAGSRLGLERGDRILTINGHSVRSIQELRHVLKDAVTYHRGQVTVLIDNVRARHGHWGAQRYVTQRTFLDGYEHYAGPSWPPTNPVPTYVPSEPTPVPTSAY